MKARTLLSAASLGLGLALAAGPALAWDLHDTLAPGPTPPSADAPPADRYMSPGAHLRLPDVDARFPYASGAAPVHESRCADAIAKHGEMSAEAWTQC